MKEILNRLINHESLSKEEAKKMIFNIADNQYNSSQISSFLTMQNSPSFKYEILFVIDFKA